ncbi:hypothetical protein DL240_16800 [Lujinxingia litoralis]|uniref:Roadblock/LAMTOR2 domain-containing protein n=1 Tax=Lujinxingia litoralis TaxID=2211119 RepID=A0A328C209_9DELT|nr:hypothetical protein [Lujinxingia litoralis]RAL20463.1 hypothetical protein DL240_16800 [Lujinxingia litoralis]
MTAQSPQLLDALIRHDRVKALMLIDEKGTPLATRGQAHAMRSGADEATVLTNLNQPRSRECVYIKRHGHHYFLIVIFEENVDFETLKRDIDATITAHQA